MTAARTQTPPYTPPSMTTLPLLDDSFIASYADRHPEWGPLGQVVYLRTYSRFLPALGRRERWHETVQRVVEHSLSLDIGTPRHALEQEAKDLFDAIWNLRAFPSGRALWIAGTDHVKRNGMAMFNCCFTNITSVEDFHDMVILLMNGSGVGFGVRRKEVEAFKRQGAFTGRAEVTVLPYEYVGMPGVHDDTLLEPQGDHLFLTVGDSREGWAQFTREFLRAFLFGSYRKITINLNAVRPQGSVLKTFGGKASGPEPLIEFIQGVLSVIGREGGITSVALLDIANLVGRMVVAGGTRRSAQIGLGDATDVAYMDAKTGPWWEATPWRSQSNNSIVFEEKPERQTLIDIFKRVLQYGEPGFINGAAARMRRLDWEGINPCAEILLGDGGMCNLVTKNLGYYANRPLDIAQIVKDTVLIARHCLRVTNVNMPGIQAKWDRNQKADRLLGVSFTGYGDFVDAHDEGLALRVLKTIRAAVVEVGHSYADQMGIPRPLLSTTVKPEGSISQLPGVSSGVHDAYAPHFLRRVRVSNNDAVAQALDMLGVPGEDDQMAPSTRVYSFPIKTHAQQDAASKSATQQLDRYFNIMQAYVQHNASVTISIAPEEVEDVTDLLLSRWDEYVGVSFLPKMPGSYPQMPYEAISAEAYHAAHTQMPDLNRLEEYVRLIEEVGAQASDELDADCATGACPIR